MLPFAGVLIVGLMLLFAFYVRSVPPVVVQKIDPAQMMQTGAVGGGGEGTPEFMYVDTSTQEKKETEEAEPGPDLVEEDAAAGGSKEGGEESETIEL
jgi:hypothetical protein